MVIVGKADEAESETLSPKQKLVGPPGMMMDSRYPLVAPSIAMGDELAEHPLASVMVTEYNPPRFTDIDEVVAPVLHKYCCACGAFNCKGLLLQIIKGPEAPMIGVGGGCAMMT